MLQRCLFRSRHPSSLASWIHTRSYRTKGSKNKKTLTLSEQEAATEKPVAGKEAWDWRASVSHGSRSHQDLGSFLKYAEKRSLSETSTVYVGTHYEYTVSSSLNRLGFNVLRTGKTSDYGIDLLGWWRLPAPTKPIKVLFQCKAYEKALAPQNVRELEGSFPGAPAHWQGKGVMGFLVAPGVSTKGMRDALIKSSLPLGYLQVTREGKVLQMLWNHQATLWGLEGLGVTTKFNPKAKDDGDGVDREIVLKWNGFTLNGNSATASAVATEREEKEGLRRPQIAGARRGPEVSRNEKDLADT